jgi:hypothetical protein
MQEPELIVDYERRQKFFAVHEHTVRQRRDSMRNAAASVTRVTASTANRCRDRATPSKVRGR